MERNMARPKDLKKSNAVSDTVLESKYEILDNPNVYNFARNELDTRGRTHTDAPEYSNQLYKEYKDYKDPDPPYKEAFLGKEDKEEPRKSNY